MVSINIYMKSCLGRLRRSKGFTLIELLVVIGILGVLAAALVATIDPFEQLKKADDSKIKNMVVEFQNGNIRYYTTHTAFPWNDSGSAVAACTAIGGADITALSLMDDGGVANAMTACIGAAGTSNTLIGEGELKTAFTSNTNDLERVRVSWDFDNQGGLIVCYAPTSKSQKASPETLYDNKGDPQVGCPNASAVDGLCWWCSR